MGLSVGKGRGTKFIVWISHLSKFQAYRPRNAAGLSFAGGRPARTKLRSRLSKISWLLTLCGAERAAVVDVGRLAAVAVMFHAAPTTPTWNAIGVL